MAIKKKDKGYSAHRHVQLDTHTLLCGQRLRIIITNHHKCMPLTWHKTKLATKPRTILWKVNDV